MHSPRIRGDGPTTGHPDMSRSRFSPYSRGWSLSGWINPARAFILPVFAGMVPGNTRPGGVEDHSPRIRGDGPSYGFGRAAYHPFSPYSRGWSRILGGGLVCHGILPVFAGMVRISPCGAGYYGYPAPWVTCGGVLFSPYSRGWPHPRVAEHPRVAIFPVFAGMVPVAT